MIFDIKTGQIVSGTSNPCLFWGDDFLHCANTIDTSVLLKDNTLNAFINALGRVSKLNRNNEITEIFFTSDEEEYRFYVEPADNDKQWGQDNWRRNVMISTQNVVIIINLKEDCFPALIQFLKEKN